MKKTKTISIQGEAFIAKAKELGAETSEAAFNAVLKRVGSAKVAGAKPKAKPSKKSR